MKHVQTPNDESPTSIESQSPMARWHRTPSKSIPTAYPSKGCVSMRRPRNQLRRTRQNPCLHSSKSKDLRPSARRFPYRVVRLSPDCDYLSVDALREAGTEILATSIGER